MLVAALILALYFWAFFVDVESIGAALLVSDAAAIMAGTSMVIGFVSYLWAPKKYILQSSLTAYFILCTTAAMLILNTGGTSSPFIALWMIVSVFAGIFGLYGILPLFFATVAYMIAMIMDGFLGREAIVAIALAGELPLVLSYIIWHAKKTEKSGDGDRSYHELASELSQVAGKSEVVINAIADGVIAIDSQGVIQLINPAAQQIIGWGKQDALALNYKSVLKLVDQNGNELAPSADPVSLALTNNQKNTTNKLSLLTNSGKKILVSVVVSPVGQLGAGVIIVFRDITKEKAEEREQAEFISTASHEMRTPVASIEGYLGLALNPSTAQIDDKARDFITKAHESAQHLGRLFQDLLDVTKAEDGRLSNNPKVVDVVAYVADIVQGLRLSAEQKGLRVFYKPLPDDSEDKLSDRRLSPVYYANVDNDHLREIVSNLIENAIKYTPQGDIVIDVTGDGDTVTISVKDSGIGIPKEDQSHLFQKFYRVDNSDTREIGGTGLGLYLCRRLAETMNGRLWLDSEYKAGSTFYLEIPRTDHEDAMRLIETTGDEDEPSKAPSVTPETQQTPTSPIIATSSTQTEGTFTSPPAKTIVEQLQTSRITPPHHQASPSVAPMQNPTPARAPIYQSPTQTQPNTPLSSIEQDPRRYMRPRPNNVPIPPRGPQNQP